MSDEDMVVMPVGQTVTIDLPASDWRWTSELMPDGSTRHERADGRVIVVRPAPTETIDGTAAEYPGTLTAEARAERAEAQLAALREAARNWRDYAALSDALADTAAAAEAHDERMRAEGRDETMADFTATRLFEAERDALAGQLAALREAARETLIAFEVGGVALEAACRGLLGALVGAPAAEAHDRRVRADALREAAGTGRRAISAAWLRARADEIERG